VAQRNRAGVPVDIVEADASNLAAAKSKIKRATHDGVGAV
jgi:hypothetical protein